MVTVVKVVILLISSYACNKETLQGVPTRLIADNAPLYCSNAIAKYLADMFISLWQCKAKYQHQNYMERRWQVVKRYTNRLSDCSGAPSPMWFYAMILVMICLNNMVDLNLACGTQSPIAFSTGMPLTPKRFYVLKPSTYNFFITVNKKSAFRYFFLKYVLFLVQ